MAEKTAARMIITGKVQGVCFRLETREAAREYGTQGWVRNLADGTVEVWAEGEEAQVQALIEWCRKGAPFSRVDQIEVVPQDFSGRYPSFEITY
ncbi:MAG: acylphosphatase [Desulfobacterales bacterium]|jgi:acylphosphatase